MLAGGKVSATYLQPSPKLGRFFGGLFLIEIEVDGDGFIEDFMFPDWGAMRFNSRTATVGTTRQGQVLPETTFSVSGPRSQEIYLRTGTVRQWGALVHPLGWALLFGEPAHEYADQLVDGMTHPAFAAFRPLSETLFGPERDPEGELQRLTEFFEGIEPIRDPAAEEISAIYAGLLAPRMETVTGLADRAGVSRRTLERLCRRAFGFSPKLLLRRQRFLRSLVDFTLDPSLKWIGAMDAAYHDQAQFIRDFREFMGMTPTEYGQREKPMVTPIIRERVRYARALLQGRSGPGRLPGTSKDG